MWPVQRPTAIMVFIKTSDNRLVKYCKECYCMNGCLGDSLYSNKGCLVNNTNLHVNVHSFARACSRIHTGFRQ